MNLVVWILTSAALVTLTAVAFLAGVAHSSAATDPQNCFLSARCRADADGSGTLTMADWSAFLAAWEERTWAADCLAMPACRFDFDRSGTITSVDFSTMLAEWEKSK